MTGDLARRVAGALGVPLPDRFTRLAAVLGREAGAAAVLFYGSNLRTGATNGVLDFYVLTLGKRERGIWPTVSYREIEIDGVVLRAKIATMRLATFRHAAKGRGVDTTIWTRFVQPAALAWRASPTAVDAVVAAVAAAAMTAARHAAALGPREGAAEDYWRALFRATYAAELRVEAPGREDQLLAHAPDHYATLLPVAWTAGGVAFDQVGDSLRPNLAPGDRARLLRRWRVRQRLGRSLNLVRLAKAAFTFDGAARYGAWKIERHTGIAVPLTPWRERHPLLAAPGVFWRVWRAQRS